MVETGIAVFKKVHHLEEELKTRCCSFRCIIFALLRQEILRDGDFCDENGPIGKDCRCKNAIFGLTAGS